MPDNNWNEILENENRRIENSNRKHRYHFNSLENMSEEFVYRASIERQCGDDPFETLQGDSFINTIKNEKLTNALRQLTAKQLQAIELEYWHGFKHWEIAQIMGIKRSAVTRLINRANEKIKESIDFCTKAVQKCD